MSSHHIVRDAQEPALIFVGTAISLEKIGQLLEWSPIVVVLENCLEHVLSWGIKIDKIICQSAHYEEVVTISIHQQPIEILSIDSTSISDFLHFAIQILIDNGHEAISIIWEDFIPADFERYISKVELIVYQENSKSYFIKRGILKKWVIANTIFCFPENAVVKGIESLTQIGTATYQATEAGLISFKTIKPVFVIEC
jgi:thiamine pyrophosphokinase